MGKGDAFRVGVHDNGQSVNESSWMGFCPFLDILAIKSSTELRARGVRECGVILACGDVRIRMDGHRTG